LIAHDGNDCKLSWALTYG